MILNNAHYQVTNVWDARSLKNVTRRKRMNNKQAIKVLERERYYTELELKNKKQFLKNAEKEMLNEDIANAEISIQESKEYLQALDLAIESIREAEIYKNAYETIMADSIETAKQLDQALDQIHELGYEFGEKIRAEDKEFDLRTDIPKSLECLRVAVRNIKHDYARLSADEHLDKLWYHLTPQFKEDKE